MLNTITHNIYRNEAFSIRGSLDLGYAFVHYNLDYCSQVSVWYIFSVLVQYCGHYILMKATKRQCCILTLI